MQKNQSWNSWVVSSLALGALATFTAGAIGCGQAPSATDPGTGQTTLPGLTTPGTSTGAIVSPYGTNPQYQFHYQTMGTGTAIQVGGGGIVVGTDASLKVTITAGSGLPLAGTGFTVGFNCEQFVVRVGSISQVAFVKKQNYTDVMTQRGYMSYDPCTSAGTSWSYDFSGALAPGHHTTQITINGAQYDNCRLFNDVYDGGCAMSSVYSSHTIDAYLQVFTN